MSMEENNKEENNKEENNKEENNKEDDEGVQSLGYVMTFCDWNEDKGY